ncbi:MAG: MEDS domain-containing protein [Nitrospirae bacterium]|nr:MEDS domain-containing protein [Nitrospirota bacterium]MBF0534836.1 MEDS domain-containing protein [Nitrospirota bacterium]MBF0616751.1 MEDS domain-containing protein [Nitrospirota bacterium]
MSKDIVRTEISLGFTETKFQNGIHMCYIYNDDTERKSVMSRYVESGLVSGEKVAYFADVATESDIDGYMKELGVEVSKYAGTKQLVARMNSPVYCPDGTFIPDRMLSLLKDFFFASLDEGFNLIRASGEMGWALKDTIDKKRLIEYESRINILFNEYPITGICQYDATKFDGGTIFDVLSVHPLMVVRGNILYNPYYIKPEVFLQRYSVNQ